MRLELDVGNTRTKWRLCDDYSIFESGLDLQAELALNSAEINQQLEIKKQRVQSSEISSVPAFIFNHHTLVTGSNSVEYFEQAITAINK